MKLEETGLTFEDIKEKVNKYMIETYERMDFLAESAKDQYIYNEKGEKYLDFYAGIAVNSAGSCNEKVVKAVVDQAQTLMHTFNYPYTIPQALLAEKVCTTIGMDKIFFQNSGTEANEAMIKMARKYGIEKYGPNRYHIVIDGISPVISFCIIFIIVRPVLICILNGGCCHIRRYFHPLHGTGQTEGTWSFDIDADHIFSALQNIVRTFSNDHTGFLICQVPDNL